jgi:hypothetical protein
VPQKVNLCNQNDKVLQVASLDVFDGDKVLQKNIPVPGTSGSIDLFACCGRIQTVIPGVAASNFAPCDTATQDVLATMGNVVNVK